jgi:hypothetical protein
LFLNAGRRLNCCYCCCYCARMALLRRIECQHDESVSLMLGVEAVVDRNGYGGRSDHAETEHML